MVANKKSKLVSMKRKTSRYAEEIHIGLETVDWDNVKDLDNAVRDTLRHYGYFYSLKDAVNWTLAWMKKNSYSSKDIKTFNLPAHNCFSMTAGSLCKMASNGYILKETDKNLIVFEIDKQINRGKEILDEKKATSKLKTVKRTPADIVKEKTSDFIAEVEEVLDMFNTKVWVDWDNYSVYNELQKGEYPYITAKGVVDYYKPLQDELMELVKKKTPDLVEAYSLMGVRLRKKYLDVVSNIIKDAEAFMAGKKAQRKPRAKKVKSLNAQVSKVQYKKEDNDFQLVSISPENIIGTSVVYLFNTRYRKMTKLVTDNSSGFEIKGTTIQNIDDDKSYTKIIRKPENILPSMSKSTKAKTGKVLDELKTKSSAATGRINSDTIIMKVFK